MRRAISILFALIALLTPKIGLTQGEWNNWYFGWHAAMTFNFGEPVGIAGSALTASAGSTTTTVSDSVGTLLFYANGWNIWNRNNVVMPNGSGLIGGNLCQQPVFSTPVPGFTDRYYVFTVGDPGTPGPLIGLHYSVVNMSLQGGLGDVISIQKNIYVPGGDSAVDQLTGTRGHNNKDIWIVVRKHTPVTHYLAYHIDSFGLDTIPVESPTTMNARFRWQLGNLVTMRGGDMKISFDGKFLVCHDSLTEICRFNDTTGVVTPLFKVFIHLNMSGVEFSPDSKYLYVCTKGGADPNQCHAYQFDLGYLDSLSFMQHKVLIGDSTSYKLQMGPNWKIYADYGDPIIDSLNSIDNPSLPFPACNYQVNAIGLLGNYNNGCLPQFLQKYKAYIHYTGFCQRDSFHFSNDIWPPPDSIQWDFGDPASGTANNSNLLEPSHLFSSPGSFTVEMWVRHIDNRTDTAWAVINILPSPNPQLGNDTTVCTGDSVTFDAGSCSTCTYQWRNLITGLPVGTNQTYTATTTGVYEVAVTDTNDCTGRDTVQFTVTPIPVVTNSPLSKTICSEQSTNIALTSNVSNVNFHWTTSLTSGNITGFSADSGLVINQILVNHNTSPGVVTYNITPKAGNCIGIMADYTVTVNPGDSVDVSIAASTNNICAGTSVTFTATPVNGGTNPTFQWKVNGINTGTNNPVFTHTPVNNDKVHCVLTSSNTTCTTNNPATSDTIVMIVNPNLPVSVMVVPFQNPVCTGTSVTFTATPVNGGTSPIFQWKVNGVNVGINNPVFSYTPANGDWVWCVLTSSEVCATGNPASSVQHQMIVNDYLPVSVAITASQNPVCAGMSVTFTAIPVNGGTSPAYQWKVNGVNVGTNSPIYSYSPVNNDVITCVLTSNIFCPIGNPATSNPVTMTVNSLQAVSVSISASQNPVCAGTTVTYTATPSNGGTSPVYQWKINGINTGTNNPVYSYTPVNNDVVTCVLTSNVICPSGNPATSNPISMTVNPILPVSVTITASANPVCAGTSVTFTATPVNGGTSPVYQWKINGVNVGTNNPVYSYIPLNGDLVSCILTSSEICTTGNPATSTQIQMVVNNNLPASVSITGSPNPFCPGVTVSYTATPVNGGTSPGYQWKVNGNNTGTNSPNYSYSPVPNDTVWCVMTSNLSCVSGSPATSNKIVMVSSPIPVVTFTRCFDSVTTLNAKPIKLKGGIPLGGTYSGPGVNSATGVFTPSSAGIGTKNITYSYTNVALCSASKTKTIVVQSAQAFTCGNNLTDIRDGKVYPTLQIGSQCWMASNLNYGTMILSASHQRDNCVPEKYCYQDLSTNCNVQGANYQWDELMRYDDTTGLQGLCPPGWHVPTEADWNILFANWTNNAFAGAPMKYSGYSGFDAILSGVRHLNVQWDYRDFATFFWSSTPYGAYKAWAHGMNDYDPSVAAYPASRSNAFSIRCLRD